MAAHLPSPSDETQPFILTDEQAKLVLAWYTLDDRGDFALRRAILERVKGWGKSPLAGSIAIEELAGPVCFDGWDAQGEPVGVPWGTGGRPPALVQIAAVSEDQADNTYGAIYQMLTARNGAVAEGLGIDLGRTRLYVPERSGELHPVTASAGSREGQRLTFAVLDETHLWTRQNGGVRLADTIRRNAAKMGGRTIETTNAPQLGLKSVAEKSGSDVERGFSGILHNAVRPENQPEPDWTDEQLLEALAVAYGDAHWIDLERLVKEIRDPSTAWDDALRFYFNIRAAGMGRAVDPRRWDELARRDGPPPQKTEVGLGFDGSISQDETWLVGCTREGFTFRIAAWSRPLNSTNWTVPRSEVMDKVEWAFGYWRVGRFHFDPPKWWTEGEAWQTRWGDEIVQPLDTNQPRRFAPAVDRWLVGIREGTHTHDGDPELAEHVKAAHLKKVHINAAEDDGRTKYVIVKGEDRRKIDGAVADILAFEAAMTMPEYKPIRTRFISPEED
jgi:hypothetical protein